jgi:hypothetical protein
MLKPKWVSIAGASRAAARRATPENPCRCPLAHPRGQPSRQPEYVDKHGRAIARRHGSGAKTDIEAATRQLEFALLVENRIQLK